MPSVLSYFSSRALAAHQSGKVNHLKGEGVGCIRTESSRQLLDDCTHKRNSKRKVGKPISLKSSFHQLSKNRHFNDIE